MWEPYRLLDPAGTVVEPVAVYLKDLQGIGRPATTQRSYGMDLLRWFRFLLCTKSSGSWWLMKWSLRIEQSQLGFERRVALHSPAIPARCACSSERTSSRRRPAQLRPRPELSPQKPESASS